MQSYQHVKSSAAHSNGGTDSGPASGGEYHGKAEIRRARRCAEASVNTKNPDHICMGLRNLSPQSQNVPLYVRTRHMAQSRVLDSLGLCHGPLLSGFCDAQNAVKS